MQNSTARKPQGKFAAFVKNNLALIIIVACILAITTIVIIASTAKSPTDPVDKPDPGTEDPTDNPGPGDEIPTDNPVDKSFAFPLLAYTSVSMDYTNDTDYLFVFNQTLNKWVAHRAVDFVAEAGTEVLAMRSGTVTAVGFNYGLGKYVEIDHGDGYIATYASLDNISVLVGQTIAKGDILGVISDTANNEFKDGAHLHLAVVKDGATISPWEILSPGS